MAKASDNVFPKLLIAEGSAPANPAAGNQGLFVDSADHKLKRVNSAGTVTVVEGGGSGSGFAPKVKYLRTTAALRVPGVTTFSGLLDGSSGASIGTTLDIVLAVGKVAAGDTIECGAGFGWSAENVDAYISFGSVVSGALVNTFLSGNGVQSLWGTAGAYTNASGSDYYVVQASDLASDGSLTVRPLGKTAGSYRGIFGSPNNSLWWVRNWGPQ